MPDARPVAAVIACAPCEAESVRLFARHHSGVRVCALLHTGAEVLEVFRGGLRPEVLVLDAILPDMNARDVLRRLKALAPDPKPTVLVMLLPPRGDTGYSTIFTFDKAHLLMRPFCLADLFSDVYALAAEGRAYQEYRLSVLCDGVLDELRAAPHLSGREHLKTMLLYAVPSERELTAAELCQRAAEVHNTDAEAVIAAVTRLSRAACKAGAPLYADLCRRYDLPAGAPLSAGRLIKATLCVVRQRRYTSPDQMPAEV